jgi:FkbM family methyltransferase
MIYYMLAGTVALNAVENLYVFHQAIGAEPGRLKVPQFDYHKVASFGSIEFGGKQKEFIGQAPIDNPDRQEYVDVIRLDDLEVANVHLIKVDIEGMEEAALDGAKQLIERDKPVLCIEWLKSDKKRLVEFCKSRGFRVFDWNMDILAIHRDKFDSYGVNVQLPEL